MAALISFSDFVGFPLKCFKVFGVAPQDNEPIKGWKRKCMRVWRIYAFFTMTIPPALMVMFVRENIDDLSTIAKSLPQVGFLLMALVKTICIYRKQESFRSLLQDFDEMLPKSQEEQNIFKVKERLRSYKRIERPVATIIIVAVFSFMVVKLVSFAIFGVWYDEKLPLDDWFPYDKYDPFWYNFTILWSLSNSVLFVGSLLGSDLILCSFTTLITMQFDILSMKLEKLKPTDGNETLKELINHHEKLLKMSKDLEEIFAPSILYNFMTSSLCICLVGYQVSIEMNADFAVVLVAAMLQVALLCNCGQKVISAAENVATSLYCCDWSDDHKKMKTILVLIMQRGQKETKLTAWKFSALNMAAFTTVSYCRMGK
jgi:hypothetical protein